MRGLLMCTILFNTPHKQNSHWCYWVKVFFWCHVFSVMCYIVTPFVLVMVWFVVKFCGMFVVTVISRKLWSFRSPCLNPCDCCLRDMLEDRMYCNTPCTEDELTCSFHVELLLVKLKMLHSEYSVFSFTDVHWTSSLLQVTYLQVEGNHFEHLY